MYPICHVRRGARRQLAPWGGPGDPASELPCELPCTGAPRPARPSCVRRELDCAWWKRADALLDAISKRRRRPRSLPGDPARRSTGARRRSRVAQELASSVEHALRRGAEAAVIAPDPVRSQLSCTRDQAVEVVRRARQRLSRAGVGTRALHDGRWQCSLPVRAKAPACTRGGSASPDGRRPAGATPRGAASGADGRRKRRRRGPGGILESCGGARPEPLEVGHAGAPRRASLLGHWQLPGWSARLLLFTGNCVPVAKHLVSVNRRVALALLRDSQQVFAELRPQVQTLASVASWREQEEAAFNRAHALALVLAALQPLAAPDDGRRLSTRGRTGLSPHGAGGPLASAAAEVERARVWRTVRRLASLANRIEQAR